MAEPLSEEKRVRFACATPVAMLFLAAVVGNATSSSAPQATSTALAAAHDTFTAESKVDERTPAQKAAAAVSFTPAPPQRIHSDAFVEAPEEDTTPLEAADLADVEESTKAEEANSSDPEPAMPPAVSASAKELVLTKADPQLESTPGLEASDASADIATIEPLDSEAGSSIASTDPAPAEPPPADPAQTAGLVSYEQSIVASTSDDPEPASPPVAESVVPENVLTEISTDPAPAAAPVKVDVNEDSIDELATSDSAAEAPAAETLASTLELAPANTIETTSNATEMTVNVEPATESPAEPADPAPADPPAVEVASSEPTELPDDPTEVKAKPFLGVGIREPSGNIVTTIWANSTAAKLGIKLGDQLALVNDKSVADLDTLRSALKGLKVSDMTTVEVIRGGQRFRLGPVSLGTRPKQ